MKGTSLSFAARLNTLGTAFPRFRGLPPSVRKGSAFPTAPPPKREATPHVPDSKDSTVHYITSVPNDRLPVFKKTKLKEVMCAALNEARSSAGFLIFAYVIMPDHLHALVGSQRKPSDVLRFVNGISARRIVDYLKEKDFTSSLQKLRRDCGSRQHKYSLWDHHSNVKLVATERGLIEKANYIHMNPVRAGLVEQPEDYRFSSVRFWQRKPLEDEPLSVDIDQIDWHKR